MALSCEESDDRARCRRRAGFEAGACEHWRRVGGSAVQVLASVAQARREMFGGGQVGLDPDVVAQVARQIADVVRGGVRSPS